MPGANIQVWERYFIRSKHIPSAANTSQPPSTMFIYQLSDQISGNRFKLFGGIVSVMFHPTCVIRDYMEAIPIN